MNSENAYFKNSDNKLEQMAGFRIPQAWWSRPHEYAWAIQFAEPGQIVADMGCGRDYRPFKDGLAEAVGPEGHVYAVDHGNALLMQKKPENMEFIVAGFDEDVPGIDPESLDRIFCISVLEDTGERVPNALRVFHKLLKPEGLVVITCDSQYDMSRPLGQYPGVNMELFMNQIHEAGFNLREQPNFDKWDALYHDNFNLTPFHCVLEKAPERVGTSDLTYVPTYD